VFVFGHLADRESFQRARVSAASPSTDPLTDWDLRLTEDTLTLGLGIDGKIGKRWTYQVHGSQSDSDGDSDFSAPAGGATVTSFDEYDDVEWTTYSARFAVHCRSNLEAGFTLAREKFTTNRFQRDGVMPYLPGALLLDFNDGEYDATIAAFDLRLMF
jgi:hypothetical protein